MQLDKRKKSWVLTIPDILWEALVHEESLMPQEIQYLIKGMWNPWRINESYNKLCEDNKILDQQ